jgi:hypothetical protein
MRRLWPGTPWHYSLFFSYLSSGYGSFLNQAGGNQSRYHPARGLAVCVTTQPGGSEAVASGCCIPLGQSAEARRTISEEWSSMIE